MIAGPSWGRGLAGSFRREVGLFNDLSMGVVK